MSNKVRITTVFVTEHEEFFDQLWVPKATTVAEAVRLSSIFPIVDRYFESGKIVYGIWGKRVRSDHLVFTEDQVEVYRPLVANPKELRRSGRLVSRKKSA